MNILSEHSSKVEKGKSGKQNLKGETNWRVNESDKQDGPKPTHFFFFSNSIQIVNGSNYRFCVPHSTTFHFHQHQLIFHCFNFHVCKRERESEMEWVRISTRINSQHWMHPTTQCHRIQFRSVQPLSLIIAVFRW